MEVFLILTFFNYLFMLKFNIRATIHVFVIGSLQPTKTQQFHVI